MNPDGLSLGRSVCSGGAFFQGELLSGNLGLVLQHCFHSSWRTQAAILSLVNKKAKPQCSVTRTNTHSCWEGSPMQWGVHSGAGAPCNGRAHGFYTPSTALSFIQMQPSGAFAMSFPKCHFQEFIECTYTASSTKMLCLSPNKVIFFTQTHLKTRLCRKPRDIITFTNGSLFI